MRGFPLGLIWLALFILAADFISKAWIVHSIPLVHFDSLWYPYGGVGVFKDFFGIEFSIVHITNKGAAWGAMADFQRPLLYLRIGLIVGLVAYLLFWNKERSRAIALTLIIAGAIGNVADYFLYGHVIDMLHFVLWGYDFPAFNVADAAIFLGVSGLFLSSYCGHLFCRKTKKNATR